MFRVPSCLYLPAFFLKKASTWLSSRAFRRGVRQTATSDTSDTVREGEEKGWPRISDTLPETNLAGPTRRE